MPQDIAVNAGHRGYPGGGAAPGDQIHDTGGSAADEQQHDGTQIQLLIQGQQSADGDDIGGGSGTIQMSYHGDKACDQHDHHDIGAGNPHQVGHQLIEKPHIIHQSEIGDGKQKQNSCGPCGTDAFGNKVNDFT